MNNAPRKPFIAPIMLGCSMGLAVSTASAVEHDLRIIPQISVGTAGVEPGLALEWRGMEDQPYFIFRPEIFVSEDGRIGGGAAVLYDISQRIGLPERQAIATGPRLVYHNADDHGWEADVMATWSYDLARGMRTWRHAVGVLGTIGVVHDRDNDDNDLGTSAGVFYSFGF